MKTAYEMRISDWSSDVCSSDLDLGIAERRPCPVRVRGDAILLVRRLCRRGFRFHSFRIVEIGALRQRRAAIARHRFRAGIVGRHQRRILPFLIGERAPFLAGLLDRHLGRSGGGGGKTRDKQPQREADAPGNALLRLERPTAAPRAPGPFPPAHDTTAYPTAPSPP